MIENDRSALPSPAALSFSYVLSEGLSGFLARPGRALLTSVGTMIGVAAMVTTLGTATSASNSIVARVDALAETHVLATPIVLGNADEPAIDFPLDAAARVARLQGVVAAAAITPLPGAGEKAFAVPFLDPVTSPVETVEVVAASPGVFEVIGAFLSDGRAFDSGHDSRREPVAVLGSAAAERLGVSRIDTQPTLRLNSGPLAVIGILAPGVIAQEAALDSAVIVPEQFAREIYPRLAPARVVARTERGMADVVASAIGLALSPNEPELVDVRTGPNQSSFRNDVRGELNRLLLLLAIASLVLGAVGIMNVTLVSVLERSEEIGVRVALGATRTHILAQFVFESTLLGTIGGILGTSTGVFTVIAIASWNDWVPSLDAWVLLLAPVLGTLIGVVGGIYPAARAARMQPVEALRR